MRVENVKTAVFALKYRLMGYKLLQNPKGTNPHEVTMMKDWFGFDGDRYDKFYHYKRVHRAFENGQFVVDKKLLMSTHLMTPEKTYKGKNIQYIAEKNGKPTIASKETMTMEEMENRPLPKWKNAWEEFEYGSDLFVENDAKSYYQPKRGLLEKLYEPNIERYSRLFGFEQAVKKPTEPSFWQVLRSNLNGGGMA